GVDEFDLTNALLLHIRRIVIKKRVEDAQLGVESYQTKLNLTEAWFNSKGLHLKVSYTTMSHPKGVLYLRKHKKKMLMRANEIHKFNDRMLNKVYNKLDVILMCNQASRQIVGAILAESGKNLYDDIIKSIVDKDANVDWNRKRKRDLECEDGLDARPKMEVIVPLKEEVIVPLKEEVVVFRNVFIKHGCLFHALRGTTIAIITSRDDLTGELFS
nr:hypothetical protein [Tanacetum cinerariifolium]